MSAWNVTAVENRRIKKHPSRHLAMAVWTILVDCPDCGAIASTLDSVSLQGRPSHFGRTSLVLEDPLPLSWAL